MVLKPRRAVFPEALILYGGSSHLVLVRFLQSRQHSHGCFEVGSGHLCFVGIVHLPVQKLEASFMSIQSPSTGTSSWNRRTSSIHHDAPFGLMKSGK